jgi:hypothetical protein
MTASIRFSSMLLFVCLVAAVQAKDAAPEPEAKGLDTVLRRITATLEAEFKVGHRC